MKPIYPLDAWLFDVTKAPLFAATVGPGGESKKVPVLRRNALIASDTGEVVGIGGSDSRLFTNREAVAKIMASHPPVRNSRMRRDRPTLQRMAGRWLRDFQDAAKRPGFSLRGHIESLRPRDSQRRQ